MKKLFTLVLMCFAVMVFAQNQGHVSTGTDPEGGGGTRSLTGSFMNTDQPRETPDHSDGPADCIVGWMDIATEPDNGRMDNVVVSYNGLIWSIAGYGSNND
ncbi:MAG: hypothetical protein K0B08_10980, partial [Bacteroidales bacterium]|nr:hypothetical protein [Bacteroidales bacterium]